MILTKGITGFYDHKDEPVNEVDADYFKKACYTMDASGFPVITAYCPENTSYYQAQIIADDAPVYMLMNKFGAHIAFCTDISATHKKFIDIIDEPLSGYGYKVLITAQLDCPLEKQRHELSQSELKQIKYHQTDTVGDIIFNEWD